MACCRHLPAAAALAASLALPPVADAGPPLSRLVVFGDSLSDVGNVDDLTLGVVPGAAYYDGRFSNGPVWVEALAGQLSLPVPGFSRGGGTDYAYGGATTETGFSLFIIPNMGRQVVDYLADGPAPAAGDLFVLLGGANDIFNGRMNPTTIVNNLSARITSLANAGADTFLVLSLPPLGQTPGALGTPDEALWDGLVESFNDQYAVALDGLATSLGVTFYRFDLHRAFLDILADPAAYGFVNVDTPAYDETTGTVVPEPDTYLFWDDTHPTTAGHAILGQRVASRLQCPADVNADGTVDVNDLVAVIVAWGDVGFAPPADVVPSGVVDVDDLVAIIVSWGPCP